MRPAQALPSSVFLSLYTPTFRRPAGLAACLASVSAQTAAADLEQIVIPDHVGYGIVNGLYGRMPWYAPALRGNYVNILADDDVLAGDDVVARVRDFAGQQDYPDVIVVRVCKNGVFLPMGDPVGRPICGQVDMTSFIVRRDVWLRHLGDYGARYEGDFDHAVALFEAGHRFAFCDVLWAIGGASNGRPE
jgi:hypothetical protein